MCRWTDLTLLLVALLMACDQQPEPPKAKPVAARPPSGPLKLTTLALSSPAAAHSSHSRTILGADGRLYLSWVEGNSKTGFALRFSVLGDSGWSKARTISTGRNWFVNWADFPSIAVLRDGTLAAHWLERMGSGTYHYGVRIACSTDGGESWKPPFWLHTDRTPTEHGFVSIVPWKADRFLAVWLDGRAYPTLKTMQARAVQFGSTGPLGKETLLDDRVCECCSTSTARLDDGSAVAVFRDRNKGEIRDILITRLGANRKWSKPRRVHADNWKMPG